MMLGGVMRANLLGLGLLIFLICPLAGLAKAPAVFSKINSLELESDPQNDNSCPAAVTSLIEKNKNIILIFGQLSFSLPKGKSSFRYSQAKTKNYLCEEVVVIKVMDSSIEKTTKIRNCEGPDKKLQRNIKETLRVKGKGAIYKSEDNEKGRLKCAYLAK